jgi:hypothetical protein
VAAQSAPLPLADYWQLIADLQQRVAGLEEHPLETQQMELAAMAEELEIITAVSLPNEQILPVDHSFLIREMQTAPPDLARIHSLLNAWVSAEGSWVVEPFDEAHIDSLREILTSPEFNYEQQQPSTLEQWWNRLRQRFLEWFSRLFPESDSPTGLLINQGITILGAIALVVVLAYALRGILADFTIQAALVAEGETGERLTADLALQRAQTLSAGGDYRTAVRYLYLSSLLLLEERGLLRYNRYLTNREYLRSIAHKPELATVLRDVIEVFDRVWYGFESLSEADYNRYAEQVATLKEQR